MTIIFLHIPKTGGTSMYEIMRWQYGELSDTPGSNFRRMTLLDDGSYGFDLGQSQALAGHIPYGIHNGQPGEFRYFTILRHPVRRIVSNYYFVSQLTGAGRQVYLEGGAYVGISLLEFAKLELLGFSDGMVRQLVGGEFYSEDTPIGEEQYQQAVEVLDNITFGLTEYYHKSVKKIAQEFGWKLQRKLPRIHRVKYPKLNWEKLRTNSKYYPIYSEIMARNQYDARLWAYAKNLMVERGEISCSS